MAIKVRPTNGVSYGVKYTIGTDAVNVAAVAEVVTLTATSGVTLADGNAVVTLPSLPAVNVPLLLDATFEQMSITFATGCTLTGDLGIKLSDALGVINVAMDQAIQTTPALVGDAVRAASASFVGWTLSGVGANVIFTKDTAGVNVGTGAVTVGTTGITLEAPGIIYPVIGEDADDTANKVATKIRAATYTGWTTGGANATVTFTKNVAGAVTGVPTFVGTVPGVTATIIVSTNGADAINGYVDFDFRTSADFMFDLVAFVNIFRAGVLTNPADLSISYPAKGVVRVDGTLVANDVIYLIAQRDSLS